MSVFLGTALPVDSVVGVLGVGGSTVKLVGDGLQVLLGLVFLASGGAKLVGVDELVDNFERWGYPSWFRLVTGFVEVGGALALLAGLVVSVATLVGGAVLGATMLGAIYTHTVRADDPPSETAKPATLLVLVAVAVLVV